MHPDFKDICRTGRAQGKSKVGNKLEAAISQSGSEELTQFLIRHRIKKRFGKVVHES